MSAIRSVFSRQYRYLFVQYFVIAALLLVAFYSALHTYQQWTADTLSFKTERTSEQCSVLNPSG
jgi:hypothetical protein